MKVIDANLSAQARVSAVNTFVTEQVNGIVTWSLDPGSLEPAYRQAKAQGNPMAALNTPSPSVNSVIWNERFAPTCSGPNGDRTGEEAAAYIASRIPHATVGMLTFTAVPSLRQSAICFEEAAAAHGLKIVAHQDSNSNPQLGKSIGDTFLTRYPHLQAIWSFDDLSLAGVPSAAE